MIYFGQMHNRESPHIPQSIAAIGELLLSHGVNRYFILQNGEDNGIMSLTVFMCGIPKSANFGRDLGTLERAHGMWIFLDGGICITDMYKFYFGMHACRRYKGRPRPTDPVVGTALWRAGVTQ